MGILVVTWNYPPRRGGIENLIANLCKELKTRHSVQVITAYSPVVDLGADNVFRAPLPGLVAFAIYALWRGTIFLARNREIVVVFGGSVLAAPLVWLLARLFSRRAIVQAHGLDVIYQNCFYQQLCVRWLKYCNQVIANSRHTAQLAQAKGVPRERLAVISPGVDLDHFTNLIDVDATKQRLGVKGNKVVLFVGRLAKRKGVKEFIENSLTQIVREIPEACFLIVGDSPSASLVHRDDTGAEIEAAIATARVEKYARLLGSLSDDDVITMYQICDVVVLPALNMEDDVEGFGIVALEAAAAGKPIVATRVGGIPDAVEDGKSGILVEPGDYTALSRAITSLLKDRELSLSKGHYARCRANEEFSWRHIAGRYENLFSNVTRAS
jgi:phosphatidylinositol alpha-1,6-mannosyltransferase